ncbi:MAG TPA: DUF1579 family protein [Blastocatellia bacterium]
MRKITHIAAPKRAVPVALQRFAGEWRLEKLSAPQDGSKPENFGEGTISAELVGDFFVVSRWSGKVDGADYKAVQSLGYDIKRKKYAGCWTDSTMSYRWELSGVVDEKSKELTIMASGPGPTGGAATFRERYQFNSADSMQRLADAASAFSGEIAGVCPRT